MVWFVYVKWTRKRHLKGADNETMTFEIKGNKSQLTLRC